MKKHCDNSSRAAGFTLVEMLVVISILLLLIGVAIPAFTGVVQRVHQNQSQAIINQMDGAIRAYQMDFSTSPTNPGSDANGLPPGNYIPDPTVKDVNGDPVAWYGGEAIVLYLTGYHDNTGVYGSNQSSAFGWRTSRNAKVCGPYNDMDRAKVIAGTTSSTTLYSDTKATLTNYNNTGQPMTFNHMISDQPGTGIMDPSGKSSHPMFMDAFGAPILYFAANYYDSNPASSTYKTFIYKKSRFNVNGASLLDGNFCHDGIHDQDLFGNVYNNGVYYNRGDGINTGVQHTGPGLEVTWQGVYSNLTPVFGPPDPSYYTNSATGALYRSDFMLMSWGASQSYGGPAHDDSNNLYGK
jgi:prepilin-type N-terminal cleavage/methylation domain-containing protein